MFSKKAKIKNTTHEVNKHKNESSGPRNKQTVIKSFTSPIPNGEVLGNPFFFLNLFARTIQAASKQQTTAEVKTCFPHVHNISITCKSKT